MGAQAQRLSKDQLLERALQCAAESNQEKAVALLRSALALSHEPTCTSHALAAAADAGLREEVLPLAEHAARVLRSPLLQGLVGLLHSRADRLDLAACHYRRSQGLAQRVPECRAVLEQIPAPANEPPPAGSLALVPTPKRERSNDAPRVESASSKELRRLRTENQARVCKVLVLEAELSVARADIQRLTEELVDRQREELAPVVLHRLVREELEAREQEAREKVEEMIGRALGKPPIQADAKLVELLRIAESTFQTSLHATVPPSAVAMQYCSALERALELALVRPFARELDREHGRQEFLRANVLRTHPRPTYRERVLEMLDPQLQGRVATLGSVVRLLENLRAPRLARFTRFVEARYQHEPSLLPRLVTFLRQVKLRLRDPSAHGGGDGVSQQDLLTLRQELMTEWGGARPGLFSRLGQP